MAADDVATAVARTAVGQPLGGVLEVAGPDRYPARRTHPRLICARTTTPAASSPIRRHRYFGVVLDDHTLVPGTAATVFPTRFADWLVDNAPVPVR